MDASGKVLLWQKMGGEPTVAISWGIYSEEEDLGVQGQVQGIRW